MSVEETLATLKKKIDTINTKKIENATKLHALEEEKNQLLSECQRLGVDPAKLDEIVLIEESKLSDELAKFEDEVGTIYGQLSKF